MNTFDHPSAASMEAENPRIVAVPPSLDAIVQGPARGVPSVEDHELRTRPAHGSAPRSWPEVFTPALLPRLLGPAGA